MSNVKNAAAPSAIHARALRVSLAGRDRIVNLWGAQSTTKAPSHNLTIWWLSAGIARRVGLRDAAMPSRPVPAPRIRGDRASPDSPRIHGRATTGSAAAALVRVPAVRPGHALPPDRIER